MVTTHVHAEGPDHYAVLGVSPTASADEIRRAYRQAARLLHTDVAEQVDDGPMATANAAWYVLRDAARRSAYDTARRSAEGSARGPLVEPSHEWTPGPRRLPLMVLLTMILCVVVFVLVFLIAPTQGPR